MWTVSRRLNRMATLNGLTYTVRYLKGVSVLLQQSRGGHRHKRTQDLGLAISRNGSGIPRLIPREHRALILKDRRYVIAWLTIVNVYRVLVIDGSLKLKTITDPGKLLAGDTIMGIRHFVEVHF